MFIHEMTDAECRSALKHATVGRLACARDNHPYIVPIYLAYNGHHIYTFSTFGQKIEWMRANPFVCVEIDERSSHEEWMSVIVFGRYEELPDLPGYKHARLQALEILQKRARWWEPAYLPASHQEVPHSFAPIPFRIHIDRMTGRYSRPARAESHGSHAKAPPVKITWLSLFGRGS